MKQLSSPKPWLVLFDIDDTLVERIGNQPIGLIRWSKALHQVYGVTVPVDHHTNYSGWVDYQIGRDLTHEFGITKREYDRKFPQLKEALCEEAIAQSKNGKKYYQSIDHAVTLATTLKMQPDTYIALLTGNLEKVGWWKLHQAGISDVFTFGMFADAAKIRTDIARETFRKVQKQTGILFHHEQITIIGDTIHDIACGKSIGAHTIGYTAGRPGSRELLQKTGADLVIDMFTSPEVYSWFRL